MTGEQLINEIVKNSSTFSKRTLFSQEKYLKRLKKKHMQLIELRYPSLHNICDYAYDLNENRVVNLRYDALGYILNSSNLTCTSKTLIIENTRGIVTAGAVERMGNRGIIYRLCLNRGSIVNYQNEVTYMHKMNHVYGNNITFVNYKDTKKPTKAMTAVQKKMLSSCTSCIIVHDRHSPKDLFSIAYPYLKPSCYVTVHCEYLQPLAELERHVRNSKWAVYI